MVAILRGAQRPQQNAEMPYGIAPSRLLTVPFPIRVRCNRYKRVIFNANSTVQFNANTLSGYDNIPIDLYILVRAGVTIQPTANDTAAFDFTLFPAGSRLTLINNGTISGSPDYTNAVPANVPGFRAITGPVGPYLNLINFGTIQAGGTGTTAITNARYIKLNNRGAIPDTVSQ